MSTDSLPLEPLVQSLLFEGYALYPYTPGATKNATPTPFGIVYPPAYAEASPHTHDHLRMEVRLEAGDTFYGDIRFLQGSGVRHQAVPRRVEFAGVPVDGPDFELPFAFEPLAGSVSISSSLEDDGRRRVTVRVGNLTEGFAGAERKEALEGAFISTHVVLRVHGGRFVSPLEGGVSSTNSYPVLATDNDDTVLGCAIVLPDHPQIAPESRVDMFDNTEIEEALLLHVHTLSDAEREAMADQDPAVRAMIEKALASTPEDIFALHGRVTMGDGAAPGESEVSVDGIAYTPGTRVLLRPDRTGDPYDMMLAGRAATIQRIFVDADERVHLGLTVDNDPVQDMMRDTGRYLYFFPHEVEVVA